MNQNCSATMQTRPQVLTRIKENNQRYYIKHIKNIISGDQNVSFFEK